jgi:NTP pyrophosphatase (non-canonical NTP hydrolase)
MPRETQQTINAWQREQFPNATLAGVVNHLKEEFAEFITETDMLRAQIEAADVVILLYCWAGHHGVDLNAAIDTKMSVNRKRKWNIQSDGTGRHK